MTSTAKTPLPDVKPKSSSKLCYAGIVVLYVVYSEESKLFADTIVFNNLSNYRRDILTAIGTVDLRKAKERYFEEAVVI